MEGEDRETGGGCGDLLRIGRGWGGGGTNEGLNLPNDPCGWDQLASATFYHIPKTDSSWWCDIFFGFIVWFSQVVAQDRLFPDFQVFFFWDWCEARGPKFLLDPRREGGGVPPLAA